MYGWPTKLVVSTDQICSLILQSAFPIPDSGEPRNEATDMLEVHRICDGPCHDLTCRSLVKLVHVIDCCNAHNLMLATHI